MENYQPIMALRHDSTCDENTTQRKTMDNHAPEKIKIVEIKPVLPWYQKLAGEQEKLIEII